jgi:hypothetical protein
MLAVDKGDEKSKTPPAGKEGGEEKFNVPIVKGLA